MTQDNDDTKSHKPLYEVGYKKPPKHTQFQPGHKRGNRKGRRKGSKNFDTAFEEASKMTRRLMIDGHLKQLSNEELIALQIVNKSAAGDPKMLVIYLNEVRRLEERRAHTRHTKEETPASDTPITLEEAEAAYREAIKNATPNE